MITPERLAEIEKHQKTALDDRFKIPCGKYCIILKEYLPDCIREIKRLSKAVEASKDCGLLDGEQCPDAKRVCETCEHNGYPDAVRRALEPNHAE